MNGHGRAKILPHPATIARAYEGARAPASLAEWIRAAVPPDVDIHAGLRQLRARSRDAAQNDDHMKFFLGLVETNVIGRGIEVEPKPKLPSGTLARQVAPRLESAWEAQCERGTWDATGQLSRVSFARLGVRTVAQDGEVLIRIHEGDPESPSGFSVELIDAEALDLDYNTMLPGGNIIRMGVEMTPRRRPVAYHLFAEPASPWGGYGSTYSATQRVRVPARDLVHIYLPAWVWGSRGLPWAHTALRRVKMLGGYEEAAITAARMAAAKSAAYIATPEADPRQVPNGVDQEGRFVQEVEPGAIEQVPWGWDLKTLDWAWPNTEHAAFCKAALRGIACGLGVSYNALANDLEGVNYSSLRSGALQERDLWMSLQAWWIEWVEQPLYRRWAAYALVSGQVADRSGVPFPAARHTALSEATYQGRRWPWVDPLKDLQAAETAVRLRTRSISSIIREGGGEPEEVWAELHEDLETLARLGIPYTPPVGSSGSSAVSGAAGSAQAPVAMSPGAAELPEDPAENPDPEDADEAPPNADV